MITDHILLPTRLLSYQSPLSEEQWQDFFTHGYCIIKQLLDSEEVNNVKFSLNNLYNEALLIAKTLPRNFHGHTFHKGAEFVLSTTHHNTLKKLYRVSGCGSFDKIILQTSRHPALLNAIADLLQAKTFEHLVCQFHAKPPYEQIQFSPHRDIQLRLNLDPNWQDTNKYGSYVQAMIAIDSCGSENGGIGLVTGSHKDITLKQAKLGQSPYTFEQSLVIHPWLKPGDVLMTHPYLLHWPAPNNSNTSKFTLLSGMCSIGANTSEYPGNCTNQYLSVGN